MAVVTAVVLTVATIASPCVAYSITLIAAALAAATLQLLLFSYS
jgi:hypothetical protein